MEPKRLSLILLLPLISLAIWAKPFMLAQAQQNDALALFQQYCTLCHGPKGEGDGVMAAQLNPKPRNFLKDPFKYGDTDEVLFKTIKNGTDTGMLPFGGTITDEQIKTLMQYIRSLR